MSPVSPLALVWEVSRFLSAHQVPHALIGGLAMALHGVPRFTADADLLTFLPVVLRGSFWEGFPYTPTFRHGEAGDPFLGALRLEQPQGMLVELLVAGLPWQKRVVLRAQPTVVGPGEVPVVQLEDLVLLKVYAGGIVDRGDVALLLPLLDSARRRRLRSRLARLDRETQRRWRRWLAEARVAQRS